MKQIEIAGKTYDLHYGIDFIREMDKRYAISAGSMTFGAGLRTALYYLEEGNPVILIDIILSATHTLKSIPSAVNIEAWLEEQTDIEQVFNDFLTALETAPMTKIQISKLKASIAAAAQEG